MPGVGGRVTSSASKCPGEGETVATGHIPEPPWSLPPARERPVWLSQRLHAPELDQPLSELDQRLLSELDQPLSLTSRDGSDHSVTTSAPHLQRSH